MARIYRHPAQRGLRVRASAGVDPLTGRQVLLTERELPLREILGALDPLGALSVQAPLRDTTDRSPAELAAAAAFQALVCTRHRTPVL